MKSNWLSDAANETADAVLEELYERKGFDHVIDDIRHSGDTETWSDIHTQISDIIRQAMAKEALNAARATCVADNHTSPDVCPKCGATIEDLCKLDREESL